MKFQLTVMLDNAAFGETAIDRGDELRAVLEQCRRQLASGAPLGLAGNVRDTNGNTVGTWHITE